MLTVNRETCTRCGLCAAVCPGGIILFREKAYPRPVPGFEQLCIQCGHCVAICPNTSLRHPAIPLEQCPEIDPALQISAAQCEQYIRARRSVREFKDTAVPRSLIEKLIDIAHYAPTGHNDQDVEWMVIDKPQTLLELEKAGMEWMREMLVQQPRMAEMMNFKGMLVKQEKALNNFLRGAPALVCAVSTAGNPMAGINSLIAVTTLELAAPSLGLGGCWGGFIYFMAHSYAPVQKLLNIPPGKEGYGFLMLGYPRYRYPRMVARKPARILWQEA